MVDVRRWRRMAKLDPARPLGNERLQEVCSWGVDALVVGGTGGYGLGEVLSLLTRLRRCGLPLALEVSDPGAVCPGFDVYLIPMVLNSTEVDWVIGHHQAAIKRYSQVMDWEKLVVEGYCILNPGATAARLSHARTDIGAEDVVAFAQLAEHLLALPVFYLEYSGMYGTPEMVRAVREALDRTLLWYGGGIQTTEQAAEMAALSDAIVIGNAVYDEAPLFRLPA
ncbi:MAG: heptaprenylglyceryl phosphate synthase [Thermoleophilia bacterium]|nr:heptaprenylglyceryl phosphate synthase [Thermoleophilia bacterium]